MTPSRIIAWDLETTNLNANYGYILCMGWKVIGEKKTHLIKISDYPLHQKQITNDREVIKKAREVLTDADGWVTWFGRYFDEPFLNSRLIEHKLNPLPPMSTKNHVDGWAISRYKLKLNSNRLATVSSFLGVEEKTPISGPHWVKAMAGNTKSLNYVYKHCTQDVIVLEQVYNRIKMLSSTHFNVNIPDGVTGNVCPKCGVKGKMKPRGWSYASVNKKRRWQCGASKCGGWSLGKPERLKDVEMR